MQKLGLILQQLREASGLTQIEVSDILTERTGSAVSVKIVSNWETDYTEIKGIYFLHLMRLFGVRDLNSYFFPEDTGVRLTADDYGKINDYIRYITYCRRGDGFPDEDTHTGDTILLYDTPAAAGSGQYLDGYGAKPIKRTSAVPATADFATWVRGDSMEPIVYDGQIAWVKRQRVLNDGETGIFVHNGEGKIKMLEREGKKVYLVSANSKYKPLLILPDDVLEASGKVIGFCSPSLLEM